ncbi:hypothetical protein ACJZ2D_007303 [Fusarium nematophilum]
MMVKTTLLVSVAALVGLAAATSSETCSPFTICADGINSCGIRFGGCFNGCSRQDAPTPPPCPETPTSTAEPTITDSCDG